MPSAPTPSATLPVELTQPDLTRREMPAQGVALCLSGGGYRAMLFHLGTLWRLNQMGWLPKLRRVSSVSGGSITAGVLGLNWSQLRFQNGIAQDFVGQVVDPIRYLASITIDQWAIGVGAILPGVSVSDRVVTAYRKYLFGTKTLQDLPTEGDGVPRFIFNATNVQSGALWRFSKPYMADWRVGRVEKPTVEVALAVAASSAFPPFLSPAHLSLNPGECVLNPGGTEDLHRPPFTTEVILTDGGVYDNLGLETAWKNYDTILVSDGGGKMGPDPEPPADWARHSKRVLDLIDNQVRSLRKRQLIDSYALPRDHQNHRGGAYWGIRSDVTSYQPAPVGCPFDAAACPLQKTTALADVPTRLQALDEPQQQRLINWGYAICDVAMRTHVMPAAAPAAFPYPAVGVG